jgi:hypothetical protein
VKGQAVHGRQVAVVVAHNLCSGSHGHLSKGSYIKHT